MASDLRKFGPKTADHITVGRPCPACNQPFAAGDWTTIVPLGPGNDPEEQERARDGRAYNAVAVEVHWACATGETGEVPAEPKYLNGCPVEVWDGPYLYRCALGVTVCAQHGPFERARRCTADPECRRPEGHGGRCWPRNAGDAHSCAGNSNPEPTPPSGQSGTEVLHG